MTAPSIDVVDSVHAFVGRPSLLAAGRPGGPLAGTTLAVKDVFDVAGTVTGAGNPAFAAGRSPATAHARAVEVLVAGGSSVIGKTITDELAYSLAGTNCHYGTPVNPAAPGRIPGGSSAGSASAVAAGLCDLALGTDTGGSIRVPASYTGILGWRPTHGSVDATGIVHLSCSFDTVGLLARDPALLAAAARLLFEGSGAAPRPVESAIMVSELMHLVDDAARSSVVDAIGGWVDATDAPFGYRFGLDLQMCADAFRVLQGREAWAEHGAWITEMRPAMAPEIADRFALASRVTAAEVERAQAVRDMVRRTVLRATTNGRVLVGPAAPGAAPPIDGPAGERDGTRARTLQLTCLAGLAGAPVVVLPVARAEGLPLGVACIGAPGSDLELLGWAAHRLMA